MTKPRNYHTRPILPEEVVNVEPYYYGDTLIGEEIEFSGTDRKGKEYRRRQFEPRLSFSEILELFDGMPVGEKLHLRTSAPGIEEALVRLGFNLKDLKSRIGDGELADYIIDDLRCTTRSELFKTDVGAYNLLRQRKELQEDLLPVLRAGRHPSKKKKKKPGRI